MDSHPKPGDSHAPESWSSDGNTLLFSVTKIDVALSTLSSSSGEGMPFGDAHWSYPTGDRFSPDGRWVA